MSSKLSSFDRRKARVRRTLRQAQGERPRLSVFRSSKHIYAQIIDDTLGATLCSASSVEKDFGGSGSNKEGARKVGTTIAERAIAKGIETVVFDRGGYIYHGRIQELAEAAREGGLKF